MKKINFDERLKSAYYLADYFKKTTAVLEQFKPDAQVTMQWFQRTDNATLCGIDYVLQLISFVCPNVQNLKIEALQDGDIVNKNEPVLKITGPYHDFGFLEGLIDGILARATSIATNSAALIAIANGKKIINMNDRADYFLNQQLDGYASYIGGMRDFVSPAVLEYIDDVTVRQPQGTMPHALIAAFDGDTIAAASAFHDTFPENDLTVLIDYDNDCVATATAAAKKFGAALKAVRIDTSVALIDASLQHDLNVANTHGVNPQLVQNVRTALDNAGATHTKIIVSSGFDVTKIAFFEQMKAPVDIYGVGEAITKERINFTGDVVQVNGKDQAKQGRTNIKSTRLKNRL